MSKKVNIKCSLYLHAKKVLIYARFENMRNAHKTLLCKRIVYINLYSTNSLYHVSRTKGPKIEGA